MMKLFVCAALILTSLSCSKKNLFEYTEDDIMVVENLPQDFIVPEKIWEQTEPTTLGEKPKQIIYTTARLIFREKNKGILKSPLMVLDFPRGGGEVDLFHVVSGEPGTFHLGFEFPELKEVLKTKVFFVSQNRQRRVDGEVLGSGCDKLLDLTDSILGSMSKEGLKLNTTRNRHSSILGGHFIIMGETEKNWMITQVTFFDSSRPDLLCPEFRRIQ